MVVATETATTTAGGGGDTTTAAAEGSLTKQPGGTPLSWRRLHDDGDSGDDDCGGDCDCSGDNDGDSGR